MSLMTWLVKKRHYVYIVGVVFGGALLASNGLMEGRTSAQAVNSMYIAPASGSFTTGDNVTVSVRVNTADQVNAAEANITYSTNLQYVSVDGNGSAFGIDASTSGGNGSVSISRATITPVSGDQLLAKVTFKVLTAGTGSLVLQTSSRALSSNTNANVVTTYNGASYTLAAPVSPSPSPTPTPPPTNTAPVQSAPAAASTKQATNKSASTIAPQGNPTTTPLPGDTTVELAAPATVQTTPDPSKEVTKVEYLLNGKSVKTDDTAPYSHDIDTTNMRNGTYELETKTYYKNGTSDVSKASLIVSNPFGLTQLWLQLRHYAWLIIIMLVIAGELIYLKFFKGRGKFTRSTGGGSTIVSSGHGQIVVGGAPSVTIQPTDKPL